MWTLPRKFRKNGVSLKCIVCQAWIHRKCTQFKSGAEAEKNKNTFICKACPTLDDNSDEEIESNSEEEEEIRVDKDTTRKDTNEK